MELAYFVEESLVDIVRGVREANKKLAAETGGTAGPFVLDTAQKDGRGHMDFDVAVTISSTDSSKAGGGFHIHVAKAEVGGEERRGEEHVSRIRFRVTHDQLIR